MKAIAKILTEQNQEIKSTRQGECLTSLSAVARQEVCLGLLSHGPGNGGSKDAGNELSVNRLLISLPDGKRPPFGICIQEDSIGKIDDSVRRRE